LVPKLLKFAANPTTHPLSYVQDVDERCLIEETIEIDSEVESRRGIEPPTQKSSTSR
jgi:hypothetical protein